METKSLSCPLSDVDFELRAKKLSQLIAERDQVESEKKFANEGFNARIKAIDEEVSQLAVVVRNKAEFRAVQVEWEKDMKTSTMKLVRLDTGTVIDTRAMTPAEKQATLNFASSKAKAEAAAKNGDAAAAPAEKKGRKSKAAKAPTETPAQA